VARKVRLGGLLSDYRYAPVAAWWTFWIRHRHWARGGGGL